MIHEEICTYEVCKLAKEKGFNWVCPHYFRLNDKDLFMIFPSEDWSDIGERINAPTQSLLQRWLREEKGYYVYPFFDNDELKWTFVVREKTGDRWIPLVGETQNFDVFEDAMEAGLKFILENLV